MALVTEHIFNEASSGQTPSTVADTFVAANNLDIDWGLLNGSWSSVTAGNGLDFDDPVNTASTNIAKSITNIADAGTIGSGFGSTSQKITCHIVVDIHSGHIDGMHMLAIGSTTGNGLFAIIAENNEIHIRWKNEGPDPANSVWKYYQGQWPSGVQVMSIFIDTTQAVVADRIKYYKNGLIMTPHATDSAMDQNESADFNSTSYYYSIGNRPDAARNFNGIVYYSCLRNDVDDEANIIEISNNLLANNDAHQAQIVKKTLRASGGDYSLASTWESAIPVDLSVSTTDEQWILECYNDWATGLTDILLIDSSHNPSTTNNIIVRAAGSDGTQGRSKNLGDFNTGFKIKSSDDYNATIRLYAQYCEIHNIIVDALNPTFQSAIEEKADNTCQSISGCIFIGISAMVYGNRKGSNVYNCILQNNGVGRSIKTDTEWVTTPIPAFKNCTLIGAVEVRNYSNINVINSVVLAGGGTLSFVTGSSASWQDSDYNASFEGSTTAPPGANSLTVDIVDSDFVDPTNDDYNVATGSALIDAGTDLSSEFTADITGTERG